MKIDKKCIIFNCSNKSSQGEFVGNLCKPCHDYICFEKGISSQAYRNYIEYNKNIMKIYKLKAEIDILKSKNKKLLYKG